MSTFEELGVSEPLQRAVTDLGFEYPMPIQERVIPRLLGDAKDIVALAQTGTGKTAAFGLPVLQRTVRVREQDIRLYPDFAEERTRCEADVGVSIRPWDVLVIAVCAGASLVRWFLGFRKLASPPPAEKETADVKAEHEDGATGEAA